MAVLVFVCVALYRLLAHSFSWGVLGADIPRRDGAPVPGSPGKPAADEPTGDDGPAGTDLRAELRAARNELEELGRRLQQAEQELQALSYAVSHDLRAPLRSIEGFSQALLEDHDAQLDAQGRDYLQRVCAASQRMGELLDGLLTLSRVGRAELQREPVNLSAVARQVAAQLQRAQPERQVEFVIADGLVAEGDAQLLRAVLEHLLGNAWKFTAKHPRARIELGVSEGEGGRAFFVRDDGAGFDAAAAPRLFGAFQRLHGADEFPGIGVGLAIVRRIVHRHGGRVWAEGAVEQGAVFYFSL